MVWTRFIGPGQELMQGSCEEGVDGYNTFWSPTWGHLKQQRRNQTTRSVIHARWGISSQTESLSASQGGPHTKYSDLDHGAIGNFIKSLRDLLNSWTVHCFIIYSY
jgi:hypothetical protein